MNATLRRVTFIACRILLLATISVAVWMANCEGPLSIEVEAKSASVPAMRGCARASIPLFLSGDSRALEDFHLTRDDCTEIRNSQKRDFVFIATYLLAYLALAALLWQRGGGFWRVVATIAAVLSVALAISDFQEDQYTLRVVKVLAASSTAGSEPVSLKDTTLQGLMEGTLPALMDWSLMKWALNALVSAALSAVFWRKRWGWSKICACILTASGLIGLLGCLLELLSRSDWGPRLIQTGFLCSLLGGFVASLLFLFRKQDDFRSA